MSDQDTNIIQSLSRGLVALEFIAEQSTTPKILAEALGVDRSTAYRMLCTLAAHGFVERDPLGERYIISSRKVFALASTIGANLHWPTLAMPWLKQLRDKTNEAVNVAILQSTEVVYVSYLPSTETITVGPMLGVRRPLYCSAVGKAIVASLADAEIDVLIRGIELKAVTPNTITDHQRFRQELLTVRRRGYAVDDEETFPGVRCVASPIHDHSHQVIAAMGISGPSSRLSMERLHEFGRHVYALACEFSTLLGATNIGIQKEVVKDSDQIG